MSYVNKMLEHTVMEYIVLAVAANGAEVTMVYSNKVDAEAERDIIVDMMRGRFTSHWGFLPDMDYTSVFLVPASRSEDMSDYPCNGLCNA